MPDRDLLAPPADALLNAWARRVRANREQVERHAEQASGPDHYAPMAARFRADPRRTDEPALDALRALIRPDETWLDVGAGGGRYALPLALVARRVIALDPSGGMLDVLRAGMDEHGIRNVDIVPGRWPAAAADMELVADVAFIAHVGYDIEEIGLFLDAMERTARRCVALLFWRRPTWAADSLWPAVHGVERAALPALRELLAVLLARGRTFEIREILNDPTSYESADAALAFARHQTWVRVGGEKDRRLGAALAERLVERDGRYAFDWAPSPLGLVSWTSPA